MPRKAISNKLRFDVFKRDGFICQYCGNHPPKAILHIDHITPVKLGGDNDINNLITSCNICNSGKAATPLSSIPKSLKDTAKDIKLREAQITGYNKVIKEQYDRIEKECWLISNLFLEAMGHKLNSIDRAKFASIKLFISKLGVYETLDAMEIATSKNINHEQAVWRYFCGICWNKVKEVENGES
jgi:hypothetical protein